MNTSKKKKKVFRQTSTWLASGLGISRKTIQNINLKPAFPVPAFMKNAHESNICRHVVQTPGMDQQWQRVSSKRRTWFSWSAFAKNAVHFGGKASFDIFDPYLKVQYHTHTSELKTGGRSQKISFMQVKIFHIYPSFPPSIYIKQILILILLNN
jgi:hypothetical protein